jgi:2-methylisocitrate lyase-like PEP mutase family enzyme
MNQAEQAAKAELFRAMHRDLLPLPNAWDAISARILVLFPVER